MTSVTLANDSFLKQFEHLNKIQNHEEEHPTIPYIDDIQKGLGDYGQHHEKALRDILKEKEDRADLKAVNKAFAGPGCYEGCGEESGCIVTVIPAKRVETKTYTQDYN